ncbi:MAG: hypothetical protein ACFWTZ_08300 [Burkholderia sp.]|jgi:uncharacterized membrane-anchored protein YhcB (DUF1043 family)
MLTSRLFACGVTAFIFLSGILAGAAYYFHSTKPLRKEIEAASKAVESLPWDDLQDEFEKRAPRLAGLFARFAATVVSASESIGLAADPVDEQPRALREPEEFFSLETVYYPNCSVGFYHNMPSLLTGLGIFFTFVGLAAGVTLATQNLTPDMASALVSGHVIGLNSDRLNHAVQSLLHGAGLAFYSSLGGLLASLALSIVIRQVEKQLESSIGWLNSKLAAAAPCVSAEEMLLAAARSSRAQERTLTDFKTNADHWADRMIDRMVEGVGKSLDELKTTLVLINATLEKTISTIASDTAGKLTEALINGIIKVFKDLEVSMQETTARLAQSARELETATGKAKTDMTGLLTDMDAAVGSLSKQTAELVNKAEQSAQAVSGHFEGMAVSAKNARTDLEAGGEKFAGAVDAAAEKLGGVVTAAGEALDAAAAASGSHLAEAVSSFADQIGNAGTDFRETVGKGAQDVSAAFNTGIEGLAQKSAEAAKNLVNAGTSLEKSLTQAGDSLASSLDKAGGTMETAAGRSGDKLCEKTQAAADRFLAETGEAAGKFGTEVRLSADEFKAKLTESAEQIRSVAAQSVQAGAKNVVEATGALQTAVALLQDMLERSAKNSEESGKLRQEADAKIISNITEVMNAMKDAAERQRELNTAFDSLIPAIEKTIPAMSEVLLKTRNSLNENLQQFDQGLRISVKALTDSVDKWNNYSVQTSQHFSNSSAEMKKLLQSIRSITASLSVLQRRASAGTSRTLVLRAAADQTPERPSDGAGHDRAGRTEDDQQ